MHLNYSNKCSSVWVTKGRKEIYFLEILLRGIGFHATYSTGVCMLSLLQKVNCKASPLYFLFNSILNPHTENHFPCLGEENRWDGHLMELVSMEKLVYQTPQKMENNGFHPFSMKIVPIYRPRKMRHEIKTW